MIRYIILALLMFFNCIFIATPYAAAKNLYNNIPGIVTKVYDGDTLTLQNNNGIYKIRLSGIDGNHVFISSHKHPPNVMLYLYTNITKPFCKCKLFPF